MIGIVANHRPACCISALQLIGMSEACGQVIVHHAGGLHKCIANGASDKRKPFPDQRFAHGIRFGAAGRHFALMMVMVDDGSMTRKLPYVMIETPVHFPDPQKSLCVADGSVDF